MWGQAQGVEQGKMWVRHSEAGYAVGWTQGKAQGAEWINV